MCDLLNQDLFAPCHTFVNPSVYYQQCRYDACKCGSLCMCTALAHYAYLCAKHKIFIDFRSDVSDCGKFYMMNRKVSKIMSPFTYFDDTEIKTAFAVWLEQ